jgi:hypothetical protein
VHGRARLAPRRHRGASPSARRVRRARRLSRRSAAQQARRDRREVSGHASEALMAGQRASVRYAALGIEQACATLRCSARRSSAGVKEEREDREGRERESTNV